MANEATSSPDTSGIGRITQSAVRDVPARDDELGFKPYVEAIAAFLDSPGTQPPITLSIEGEWGSGKSSFMSQLQRILRESGHSPSIVVSFNAWRFDKQDAMWAAFALAVTRALRKELPWKDRIAGAVKLFFSRIEGFSGWFMLLQFIAVWVVFLIAGSFALFYLAEHRAEQLSFLHVFFPAENTNQPIPQPYLTLIQYGSWTGALAVLMAALAKWGSWIRSKLFDFKLERFITRPDYASHTAFIEQFHVDFSKAVRAYAGRRKLYIFVDDLDRCDLPKAAELMQAINLMIGEDDHLVFVLGLDRDKIAAAIAAQYRELLPFLRRTPGDLASIDVEDRLAFGYEYLEKFIQLSFRVPIPDEASVLRHFVERLTPDKDKSDSSEEKRREADAQERRARIFRRIDSGRDSDQVIEVVLMVRGLFGNNPRRLKQFLNAYRLGLYLASSQGLFDTDPVTGESPLTLEQLGKIVALVMRFPGLPRLLLSEPHLLARYEETALTDPSALPPRIGIPEAVELLGYGLEFGRQTPESDRYSLENVDVLSVLRVMPAVPSVASDQRSSEDLSRPPASSAAPPEDSSPDFAPIGSEFEASEVSSIPTEFTSKRSAPPAS